MVYFYYSATKRQQKMIGNTQGEAQELEVRKFLLLIVTPFSEDMTS